MLKPITKLSISVVLLLLLITSVEARKWTSSDGRFSVEAEYVAATDTSVQLKKSDGTVINIPLAKLSEQDKQHIATLSKASVPTSDSSSEEAKVLLEKKGVRLSTYGLSLPAETELATGLKGITKNRRELVMAGRKLTIAQQRVNEAKQRIIGLTQLNVRLNAQLTTVNPQNITLNNKLVGALNANASQIELLHTIEKEAEKLVRAERTSMIEIREAYLTVILKLREQADTIQDTYEKLAADPQVTSAITELNKTATRPLEVTPSSSFLRSLK